MSNYFVFPEIDPIIVSIGPLSVRWYGLMYLIGFAAAMYLANRQADKPDSGWTRDQVSDFLFAGFLGVILGGRVGYVLFYQFDLFLQDPAYLIRIWEGGMSFHGGVLGVLTAIFWYARSTQRSFLRVGDFVVPLIPIGLGAGRIGNFINGELWGRETDVAWAVIFPNGGDIPRHPSQLYEFALEGVVLFFLLQWFIRNPRPAGTVGGLFLLGYGCFRFIVEYFRQPDAHLDLFFNIISMGQILSLPMVFAGLFLMVWGYKREAGQQKQA